MVRDIKRRRKHVLEPNSKKSYLFRPLKDRNGNILKMPSGPETYDLEGVDAGTFPDSIINDDKFNLILKSRRRNKSRKSKKSKNKSKKSKKGRKSKKTSNRTRKSRKVNQQKNQNTALNTVRNIGNRINNLL